METEIIYELISGQKLTEEEYRKYEALMEGQTIVRWKTKQEMEEEIKKAQNQNTSNTK